MADTQQTSSPSQTVPSNGAVRQGSEALNTGAQAVQQGGLATSDAMRRAADATADVMQRVGHAAGETVRQSADALAGSQRQFSQRAADQFDDVSRKMAQTAQGTASEMRMFAEIPSGAQGGMQDLQKGMAGLVEGVIRTNVRAAQELMQLANPGGYVELQQRFMREYIDTLMQGTATLLAAARRTTDEALRTTEHQIAHRKTTQSAVRTAAE